MVELEIDGRKVEMPEGSMVIQAADKLDIFVPHFCFHKKLSIAANCRMCLVEVEKAPKPLPACATPVSQGMKVHTRSEKAVAAQKSVMEFLLINHPLDCPICDQGGECQLQDLAVGYGGSGSRYDEPKRVVFHKNLGPLVSAEEMARCIHCTRCVRFGQEIAGVMELGMGGRGERSQIMSFVGRSVDSELSGNMIDVCPVGALTSKPFRYSARTWELSRRRSVAPHDGLGAPLIVQIKNNQVMRVVPFEDETLNECWISDKDRFSYEGLNSPERLLRPMIKQDGKWQEVDWQAALQYAAHALTTIRRESGPSSVGALVSPHVTTEEAWLAGRLLREYGSENIDSRLRQVDFSAGVRIPSLGRSVASISTLEGALIIGSFLRKDHPLLAARIRHAVKGGAQVGVVHAVAEDLLMPLAAETIVAPSRWAEVLARTLVLSLRAAGKDVPADLVGVEPDEASRELLAALSTGTERAVLLGNAVVQQADYARVAGLAARLAAATGASFGHLVEAANTVGAQLAGAVPGREGLNARQMVEQGLKAFVLLGIDPSLDHAFPQATRKALGAAQSVIALSSFRSPELLEVADCLLPVAPFTETAGSFVNCEGRSQSFNGVVRAPGEVRPGWKVLRVLANLLGLAGFDNESAESVRALAVPDELGARLEADARAWLEAGAAAVPLTAAAKPATGQVERIADVPIFNADPIVRRAGSLQQTRASRTPTAHASTATLTALGLNDAAKVRVQDAAGGEAIVTLEKDEQVADGVVRLAAGMDATSGLSALGGLVTIVAA